MAPEQHVAPGWYAVEPGVIRHWDGHRWDDGRPARPPLPDPGVGLAVLAHASFFIFPVVIALVLFLTESKKDARIRKNAGEALNFQASFLVVWMPLVALELAGQAFRGPKPGWLFLTMFALWVTGAVVSVVAAVRAADGRDWRYRYAIRFVSP